MFTQYALLILSLFVFAASVSAAPAHVEYSIREWNGIWPSEPVYRRDVPVEAPSKNGVTPFKREISAEVLTGVYKRAVEVASKSDDKGNVVEYKRDINEVPVDKATQSNGLEIILYKRDELNTFPADRPSRSNGDAIVPF